MSDTRIRVVHCSPDAPTVDVSVGDTTQRVSYREVTDYVTVPAGTTEVTVDSTDGNGRGPMVRATPNVKNGDSETVVIVGLAGQNSLEALSLKNGSVSVRSQHARLRFVNAVPDSPPLDFRFTEPVVDGEEVLSREIAFRENGSYRTINAGTRQFHLGTDHDDDEGYRQVFTGEKDFESGRTYTLIAVGRAGSGEYDVLSLEDVPVETPAR